MSGRRDYKRDYGNAAQKERVEKNSGLELEEEEEEKEDEGEEEEGEEKEEE